MQPPAGTRIWIAAGVTDMRRGFDGRRGDRIKLLWWDGDGLCLFCKRLEQGRFVWPQATSGSVSLTPAQLSMLLEGIDWRRPIRTAPVLAV
ncbi:isocitrate lyase [Pseudomonas veronii]|nr:isocitrate lyase [Pseudomonas veronii]